MHGIAVPFSTTRPICWWCAHFDTAHYTENHAYRCTAFAQIPEAILQQAFDHRAPHPDDDGVQFEPPANTIDLMPRPLFQGQTVASVEDWLREVLHALDMGRALGGVQPPLDPVPDDDISEEEFMSNTLPDFIKFYGDYVGVREGKHFKDTLFNGTGMMIGINCLEPGQEQHVHDHPDQDKAYLVMEGRGLFNVGGVTETVGAGHVIWAEAGVPHGVRNDTDERLVLLIAIAPPP